MFTCEHAILFRCASQTLKDWLVMKQVTLTRTEANKKKKASLPRENLLPQIQRLLLLDSEEYIGASIYPVATPG